MGEILITFIKQSSAFNLKRLAKRKGYSVKIVQTPKEISDNGCSYAVSASRSNATALQALCDDYGIECRRMFSVYTAVNGRKIYSQI